MSSNQLLLHSESEDSLGYIRNQKERGKARRQERGRQVRRDWWRDERTDRGRINSNLKSKLKEVVVHTCAAHTAEAEAGTPEDQGYTVLVAQQVQQLPVLYENHMETIPYDPDDSHWHNGPSKDSHPIIQISQGLPDVCISKSRDKVHVPSP